MLAFIAGSVLLFFILVIIANNGKFILTLALSLFAFWAILYLIGSFTTTPDLIIDGQF